MIGVLVYKWRVLNQTVLNGPGVNDTQLFKTFYCNATYYLRSRIWVSETFAHPWTTETMLIFQLWRFIWVRTPTTPSRHSQNSSPNLVVTSLLR